jgi:hypothetical protein
MTDDTNSKKLIQRRFKEFVTLQKCIEDNGTFKSYIRNIRGPSKIVNLPIGNMTEEYVEKRRKKLTKYLNVFNHLSLISFRFEH